MKRIKDERLKIKNLKNTRIAYIIQTLGIIAILGYDLITQGIDGLRENPLWLVLLITTVVFLYLSMSISVDHENGLKSPQKQFKLSLIILLVLSVLAGFFVSITDGFSLLYGLLSGGILFICGLIPTVYIYSLRKKQLENNS